FREFPTMVYKGRRGHAPILKREVFCGRGEHGERNQTVPWARRADRAQATDRRVRERRFGGAQEQDQMLYNREQHALTIERAEVRKRGEHCESGTAAGVPSSIQPRADGARL